MANFELKFKNEMQKALDLVEKGDASMEDVARDFIRKNPLLAQVIYYTAEIIKIFTNDEIDKFIDLLVSIIHTILEAEKENINNNK